MCHIDHEVGQPGSSQWPLPQPESARMQTLRTLSLLFTLDHQQLHTGATGRVVAIAEGQLGVGAMQVMASEILGP